MNALPSSPVGVMSPFAAISANTVYIMAVINNANFSSSEVASTFQSPSGNGIDQGEPTEPLTMTIKFLPQNNNAYHKINNAIHIVIHHSGTHPLLLLIPPILVSLAAPNQVSIAS